jgi:chromosome segregation ATPase
MAMEIVTVRKATLWTLAAVLGAGLTLGSPPVQATEPVQGDSAQVTKLLKEARSEAVQLEREAERLESYKSGGISRESHRYQLAVTRDHVNELGKTLDKLEARKAEGSAWQQKAIEEMRPVLERLAVRTTQAIEHVNLNAMQHRHPDYHDVLTDKSELAQQLADLLNDHVKYGETKADLEELESKVGPLS